MIDLNDKINFAVKQSISLTVTTLPVLYLFYLYDLISFRSILWMVWFGNVIYWFIFIAFNKEEIEKRLLYE